ncbi:DUF1524 domain-containing protein, partial [Alkalihalophilus lindianensis]
PEMSNAPFETKRALLVGSSLHQNRLIGQAARWTEDEMALRADDIADRIIAIWPGPIASHA